MTLHLARARLTKVWLIGGLAFLLLLAIQSLRDVYGETTADVWAWAIPTVMPTLLLIVGVLVGAHLNHESEKTRVGRTLFVVTYVLSLFYLVVLALTVLLAPVSPLPPVDLMKMSNFWLGPLQGLLSGAFGVFFMDQRAGKSAEAPTNATVARGG